MGFWLFANKLQFWKKLHLGGYICKTIPVSFLIKYNINYINYINHLGGNLYTYNLAARTAGSSKAKYTPIPNKIYHKIPVEKIYNQSTDYI